MENKNNTPIKAKAEESYLIETLAPDMVPVPQARYEELLRKEVELDLIYASRQKDKSYTFDGFIDKLMALRFGETEEQEC